MEGNNVDYEWKQISNFQALMLARRCTYVLLLIIQLYFSLQQYQTIAFYILLYYLILPYFLEGFFKERNKNEEFTLNVLRERAKYTGVRHKCNNYSYYILIIILFIWAMVVMSREQTNIIGRYAPHAVLFCVTAIRLIGIIYYRIKNNYVLKYNKY